MRSVIRFITRKSRGDIAIREVVAEGEHLIAGRGNDCDIHLPDPRVLLHHAEFSLRSGALYVTAAAGGDLRVDGNLSETGRLAVGQKVRLGPYEITVEPPGDADVTLSVEMVQRLDDDLERLLAGSRLQRTFLGLGLRSWSWIFATVVLMVTLVGPLVLNAAFPPPRAGRGLNRITPLPTHSPTMFWSSGTVTPAHRFFGDNCATCHTRVFARVKDSACLDCHGGMEQHAGRQFKLAMLTQSRCEDCHKEHLGDISVSVDNKTFCGSCHAELARQAKGTLMRNVSDFAVDHPEFRPTVILDPADMRTDRSRMISDTPAPQQNIGLKFPHDKHLLTAGVRDGSGKMVKLACADCHRPDTGGVGLLPVNFERNCHDCHQLKFDAQLPDRELIHGRPQAMFQQVRDIYDAVAARGGYEEPEAPAIVRRRPGTPLTPEEKKTVADWAAAKTQQILDGRFGKGLCGECHVLVSGPAAFAAPASWTVSPVVLSATLFPMAHFNHAKHNNTDCHFCHAAQESVSVSDVLMPSITVCRSCHGSERAADRVPSTCVECHYFHHKDVKALRETVAPPTPERKAAMVTP